MTRTAHPAHPARTDRTDRAGRAGRAEVPPPPAARLVAQDLTLGYHGAPVVSGLSTALPDQQVTSIIGANACGKSTLLRGLARLLNPMGGQVLLDGEQIHRRPTRQVARTLGLLPQQPAAPEGITVLDLVGRGRYPHQRALGRRTQEDLRIVTESLAAVRLLDQADAVVDELSGGQRQRAWIAMALAQQPQLLLLDEPTTFLDIAHQIETLELIGALNRSRRTTVVMVLHDLNLAARYSDHLIAMKAGRIVADGPPGAVVTTDVVADVFGLRARVVPDPVTGGPLVVPEIPTPDELEHP